MIQYLMAMIAGIVLIGFLPQLPSLLITVVCSIFTTLIIFYCKISRKYTRYFVCFCLGFSWTIFWVHWQDQWQLPKNLIAQPVSIQGKIDSVPDIANNIAHFNFQMRQFNQQSMNVEIKLVWFYPKQTLQAGQTWQLTVRLKPPHGLYNPAGFDYERWLWSENLHASGYVVAGQLIKPLHKPVTILEIRQQLSDQIKQAVTDPVSAAILSALMVGIRNGLTPDDWQILQRTGTNHLIAIAGLHLGFIALMIYFLVRWSWSLWPRLLLYMPAQRFAQLCVLLAIFIYSALAGWSLPTERAFIMLSLWLIINASLRNWILVDRWWLAVTLILLWQPFIWWNASFWLSFVSMAWLGYVTAGRLQQGPHWKTWLNMQVAIFVGLLPWMLFFFQQIAWVMLLANLVAIPWIGLVILPLVLLAALVNLASHVAFVLILHLAAVLLWPLWKFLSYLAQLPMSSWQQPLSSIGLLIPASVATLLILAPINWSVRMLGVVWYLPLFLFKPAYVPAQTALITTLDVGQGLAMVVQTQHHVLIYDAGPAIPNGFDAGSEIIVPYLKQQQIKSIDVLMISHGDLDHRGGAPAILTALPVRQLLTSAPQFFANNKPQLCQQGQQWQWDGVTFAVLSPPTGMTYADNNSSCVLKITAGKSSALLPGDIQANQEQWLLTSQQPLSSAILIAPHHGSDTSSSVPWLRQVAPQQVIISAGYYNRYHLPSPVIVARYQSIHAKLWRTAQQGAIQAWLRPNGEIKMRATYVPHYFWQLQDW